MSRAAFWLLVLAALTLDDARPVEPWWPVEVTPPRPCMEAGGTDWCRCLAEPEACQRANPELYREVWEGR